MLLLRRGLLRRLQLTASQTVLDIPLQRQADWTDGTSPLALSGMYRLLQSPINHCITKMQFIFQHLGTQFITKHPAFLRPSLRNDVRNLNIPPVPSRRFRAGKEIISHSVRRVFAWQGAKKKPAEGTPRGLYGAAATYSPTPVRAVPSAQARLTSLFSLFGMGRGWSTPL